MKLIMMLVFLFLTAGCAAQLVSSNERTVIVKAGSQQIAEAQKVADAECAKYGRFASLSIKPTLNQFVYDCVK